MNIKVSESPWRDPENVARVQARWTILKMAPAPNVGDARQRIFNAADCAEAQQPKQAPKKQIIKF